jgi:ABC-type dipeptide/oligopeptide/nickel transport system permease component
MAGASGSPEPRPAAPPGRATRGSGRDRRSSGSPFLRYLARRLILIPVQLVFILLILYLAIDVPSDLTQHPPMSFWGIDQGFFQLVINIFTGNWGTADYLLYRLPWTQTFAYFVPPSVQLAAFALPIAALLAYPMSLLVGWSRRTWLDAPSRFITLTAALLPVFVVGTLVLNALFYPYLNAYGDIPGQGLIPSSGWFFNQYGYPSWIIYNAVTQPTGFPLIDAIYHHAWTIASISLTKTLIQASVVAVAYVAIFFRHARAVVRSTREETYIVGARSRGVSERTLLWRHAARAVTPPFLLIFALTIPEYLAVQFAVEVAFTDQSGFGYLIFSSLVEGQLAPVIPLVFLIAIVVLAWALLVDLLAIRIDPRSAVGR